jgi:hypothetical protein
MAIKSNYSATISIEGYQPGAIVNRTLHSAQFWELKNSRNALLFLINEVTSPLDIIDKAETRSLIASEGLPTERAQLHGAISAYELLLYVPIEYLPRTQRQNLIHRAFKADLVLCQTVHGHGDNQSIMDVMRSVTTLRVFLKRWFSFQSAVDHNVSPYIK